jgi:hypothetical protein
MNYATELHAGANPACEYCKGEGFIICEDDAGAESHLICNCIPEELSLKMNTFLPSFRPPSAVPEAGEEVCLSVTVMLTNPDYISDELPSWENDSADVNPINLLFGELD